MFDRNLFEYDSANHLGYYNGKLVPSTTQLLELLFPLDENIPADRLAKASERGTEIHSRIAQLNEVFKDCTDNEYELLLKDAIKYAIKSGLQELIDYVSLLKAYRLVPVASEEMVFLLDENQELICYGTTDVVFKALDTIQFDNDNVLFNSGNHYLMDYKTTSTFASAKTSWQTMVYAIAYEQAHPTTINKTYGIWLREGIKIMPLNQIDPNQVIKVFKNLRGAYDIR